MSEEEVEEQQHAEEAVPEDDRSELEEQLNIIKSGVSILTSAAGEEFICIPKKAYKYVLCIPPTIALTNRVVGKTEVKEYPVPLDWGLLVEFFVNGIKTPFQGLNINIPSKPDEDSRGRILPQMPTVRIIG